LEDVFPHVPFPSDHAHFLAAAELGREIRAVETFARPHHPAFLTRALARVETEPDRTLDASDWSEGEFFLCADHTGRVSGKMANWLPNAETEQLRLEFHTELERLSLAHKS
jgi:hypothetical protein